MKITNETLKKLTITEVNDLDLFNHGIVGLNQIIPKSRVNGLKTTLKTDSEIHYENEHARCELVRLADGNYIFRIYRKHLNEYDDYVQPITAMCYIR